MDVAVLEAQLAQVQVELARPLRKEETRSEAIMASARSLGSTQQGQTRFAEELRETQADIRSATERERSLAHQLTKSPPLGWVVFIGPLG